MSDAICKHCTIKLRSALKSESGKWEPFTMVWWGDGDITVGHAIARELQDTEVLANTVALEHAKAWVDAKCSDARHNAMKIQRTLKRARLTFQHIG